MFKDHFTAILSQVDKTFLMHLLGQLLPQAEHTVNMMRPTNIVLTISAYSYTHGQDDYNKLPLAPLLVQSAEANKPDVCKT